MAQQIFHQISNSNLAPCDCLACKWEKESGIIQPDVSGRWALDRLEPRHLSARPDLPVFWLPYYEVLGHYWIKQTKSEDTRCYLARCEDLYRFRFSEKYTEQEFVNRVILGLRSFSWSVLCYAHELKTFRKTQGILREVRLCCQDFANSPWNQVIFPEKWRVSINLIKACLSKVLRLRKALRAPEGLITQVQTIFTRSAAEIKKEFGGSNLPVGILRRHLRQKILNSTDYKALVEPLVFRENIFRIRAYAVEKRNPNHIKSYRAFKG